jgi:hypothetical protein
MYNAHNIEQQPTQDYKMKTKYCPKCKTEKDRSEFSKDKHQKDGLRSHCRECRSSDHQEYYKKYKSEIIKRDFMWNKSNPEKSKARALANSYPNLLVIKGECSCDVEKKQKHHPDYSKPFEVVILCASCHAAEHARLRSLTAQAVAI